jgi:hypothetical protein
MARGGLRETWTDAEMLEMLEMRAHMTAARAADLLTRRWGRPVSRNAICGAHHRVMHDLALIPDLCARHENRDGGMPSDWWRAGLARRGEAS